MSGIDNSCPTRFERPQCQSRRKTKKVRGKKKTVGFYEKVGCKGGKRLIRATFIDRGRVGQPLKKFDRDQAVEVLTPLARK